MGPPGSKTKRGSLREVVASFVLAVAELFDLAELAFVGGKGLRNVEKYRKKGSNGNETKREVREIVAVASSGAGRKGMGSAGDDKDNDNFTGDSELNRAMPTLIDSNSPMALGLEKRSTATINVRASERQAGVKGRTRANGQEMAITHAGMGQAPRLGSQTPTSTRPDRPIADITGAGTENRTKSKSRKRVWIEGKGSVDNISGFWSPTTCEIEGCTRTVKNDFGVERGFAWLEEILAEKVGLKDFAISRVESVPKHNVAFFFRQVARHVLLAEHSASGRVLDITAQLLLHNLVTRLRCGIAEDIDEGLSKQGPVARTISVKRFPRLTD
ncbi:hypothetical protein EDB87DRAFT_1573709 [Lactarius vividus]|nr:hypothetical protein EDB87DRAFT_1573709 [Lactarius vividus]